MPTWTIVVSKAPWHHLGSPDRCHGAAKSPFQMKGLFVFKAYRLQNRLILIDVLVPERVLLRVSQQGEGDVAGPARM